MSIFDGPTCSWLNQPRLRLLLEATPLLSICYAEAGETTGGGSTLGSRRTGGASRRSARSRACCRARASLCSCRTVGQLPETTLCGGDTGLIFQKPRHGLRISIPHGEMARVASHCFCAPKQCRVPSSTKWSPDSHCFVWRTCTMSVKQCRRREDADGGSRDSVSKCSCASRCRALPRQRGAPRPRLMPNWVTCERLSRDHRPTCGLTRPAA
jgi:hypothetical protein